ncbi:hypothetical protein IWZ01DRAFT_9640 [Phyllosticta capitalensis]
MQPKDKAVASMPDTSLTKYYIKCGAIEDNASAPHPSTASPWVAIGPRACRPLSSDSLTTAVLNHRHHLPLRFCFRLGIASGLLLEKRPHRHTTGAWYTGWLENAPVQPLLPTPRHSGAYPSRRRQVDHNKQEGYTCSQAIHDPGLTQRSETHVSGSPSHNSDPFPRRITNSPPGCLQPPSYRDYFCLFAQGINPLFHCRLPAPARRPSV